MTHLLVARSFRRLGVVAGAALAALSAAPAAADYPPNAGSQDDVSYGDVTRAPLATEAASPFEERAIVATSDDTRYDASAARAVFGSGLLPADSGPALASGHDDTDYARADARPVVAVAKAEPAAPVVQGRRTLTAHRAPAR